MGVCVVCEAKTSGSLEFCHKHYQEHFDDIKSKKPWVREIKNDVQRERRRAKREFDTVSLDGLMDRYERDSR